MWTFIKKCFNVLIILLVAFLWAYTLKSDSQLQPPVTASFIRLGTTSKYMIDVEKGTMSSNWDLSNFEHRTITLNLKLIPHKPMSISDGERVVIATHFVNELEVNCSSINSVNIKNIMVFDNEDYVMHTPYGGPLAKWEGVGRKEVATLWDALCLEQRLKLVKPVEI